MLIAAAGKIGAGDLSSRSGAPYGGQITDLEVDGVSASITADKRDDDTARGSSRICEARCSTVSSVSAAPSSIAL